jgi:hypothetical protein
MSVSTHRLTLAVAALLVVSAALYGQAQGLPQTPVPVLPADPRVPTGSILGPPQPVPDGPSVGVRPAPQPAPFGFGADGRPLPPPPASPFPVGDPGSGLCNAVNPNPWFFDVELDFIGPTVKNHLRANVTRTDGSMTTVSVAKTDLDWTVMPRLEIGYRLPDNSGAFAFGYRFLVSEGTGGDGHGGGLRSRIDLNVFDFDYISPTREFYPRWDLTWRVGARLATSFYDARDLFADGTGQRASNYFVGAGPHGGVEIDRRLPLVPGLSVVGRIDGSVLIGEIDQRYVDTIGGIDDAVLATQRLHRKTQTVEVLMLEAGVRYVPPGMECLSFSAGYQVERWFDVGHSGGANLETTTQGLFLRGQIDF